MNNIILIGRIAAAPEVRYFESGSNVAKFRIAVDRIPRNGEKQEPDWFSCECWGKLALVAADYLHKGKQVAVQGRIEFEHWQDKATLEKRSKPVVKINNLELLGNSQAASDEETPSVSPVSQPQQVRSSVPVDRNEEDVHF